ncbi:MAG: 16S rRNA (guanine(527)-N(7))-methyltransferase RsmG [Bdellovibrionales bacterium]|nr:16S rRNA (guanine(527)-N(7))-methyltransferase RsmG [Bdellovibrionales bacterium]
MYNNYGNSNNNDGDEKRVAPEKNWRIPKLFPELGQDILNKLKIYHTELIRFNGRINLISNRTERDADIVHIADCILATKLLINTTQQKQIFDIGSGNGLPGIVVTLLDATRHIVFVDKDARKIEFLKHIASRLELKNVQFIHAKIEEVKDIEIHCAISRGFASITKSIMALRKPCPIGAEYYHMKSDSWVREIAQIPTQVCKFWEPSLIGDYVLPTTNIKFSLVLTKKIA